MILDDAFISIAANDLSAFGNQLTLSYGADSQEKTAFGDDTHIFEGGLKTWSVDITFHQNFAAASIDSILFPLVGTTVALIFRPTSAAKGASNPEFTGNGVITSYQPLGNQVGDKAGCSISIVAAGTLARGV